MRLKSYLQGGLQHLQRGKRCFDAQPLSIGLAIPHTGEIAAAWQCFALWCQTLRMISRCGIIFSPTRPVESNKANFPPRGYHERIKEIFFLK
jgi:hypothetical protein